MSKNSKNAADWMEELDRELGGESAFTVVEAKKPVRAASANLDRISLEEELNSDATLRHLVKFQTSFVDQATHQKLEKMRALLDLNAPLNTQIEAARLAADLLDALGNRLQAKSLRKRIEDKSELDAHLDLVNERLKQSRVPAVDYTSDVFIYGYSAVRKMDEIEYQKSLVQSAIDRIEGRLLAIDDGRIGKGVRSKATLAELKKNIERLGMQEDFRVEGGKVYEKAESYKGVFILDDLLRHQEEQEFLGKFDKVEAIGVAAAGIAEMHYKVEGGIGEVLGNDLKIVTDGKKIKAARFALPDVVYAKDVQGLEQKTTDLLDFCFSIGSAAVKSAGSKEAARMEVRKYIGSALESYGVKMDELNGSDSTRFTSMLFLKNLAKTRPVNFFHNQIRYGFDQLKTYSSKERGEFFEMIRAEIIAFAEGKLTPRLGN